MSKREKIEGDTSTEDKIKNAARLVFHKKGFAATRTRDIAEEAGINLALLNYYFRSKEKLFDIIMLESLQAFLQTMLPVFHEPNTTLEQKLEMVVDKYINLLVREPEIPLFVLSEIRTNPEGLFQKMNIKEILMNSYLIQQYRQGVEEGKYHTLHPMQFFMNLMGLTVFPFIAKPMFKHIGDLPDEVFNAFMEERKTLIPGWVQYMIRKE